MTRNTRLAADNPALEDRRDQALERLAHRAGVAVPEIRRPDGPRPLSSVDSLLGGLAMDTFLVEMVAALAVEVDALKADVATLRGEQGSTSREAKDTETRDVAGDMVQAREQAKRDELAAILRRRFIVASGPAEEWETTADVIAEHHRHAGVAAEAPDDHAG